MLEYLGYAWDFFTDFILGNPMGTVQSVAGFIFLASLCVAPLFAFYVILGGLWKPLKIKQQWNLREGEYAIILDPEDPRYRPPDEVRVYEYR